MKDTIKVEKLNSIESKYYLNVDLDHLIMYVAGKLNSLNIDLSYENIVVAAFKMFPQKFSLNGYLKYPDSDRIRNCLNRCSMTRKWLGGKALHGFVITELSKMIIQESEKKMFGKTIVTKKTASQTRRKELILSDIEKSPTYVKYLQTGISSLTESDFCFILQGTLDTSSKILHDNLKILKLYSKELDRIQIYDFLDEMENKFKEFLINY